MQKNEYRIGPGASSLLMILVILTLTVLGVLAFISARADARLSERNVSMIESYYAATNEAEVKLSQIDGVLANCRKSAGTDEEYVGLIRENLPAWAKFTGDGVAFNVDAGAERSLYVVISLTSLNDIEKRYIISTHSLQDMMVWEDGQPLELMQVE